MNSLTRMVIEHAYRVSRNCFVGKAGQVPGSSAASTWSFLHEMLCSATGRLDLTEEDVRSDSTLSHAFAALVSSLGKFAKDGFPVITMSPEMAWSLSETDTPIDLDTSEPVWRLSTQSFMIDIGGDGAMLGATGEAPVPENILLDALESDFDPWVTRVMAEGHSGLTISWGAIPFDHTDSGAVRRLFANVALILQEPPEGVSLSTHRPSLKAARKQGRNPACVPHVAYVIGSTAPLMRRPREHRAGPAGSGSTWTVRSPRRGHFARQVHGPRNSLRKRIWRMPTWCGPEDAPLSVHAVRIVGHP